MATTQVPAPNSSDAYKRRYFSYEKTYVDSCPEPPDPMEAQAAGGQTAGGTAARSVHTRQQRYNDRTTTQSTQQKTGGKNAS